MTKDPRLDPKSALYSPHHDILHGMKKIWRDAQARVRNERLACLADLCGRDPAMMGGHISQGGADAR